VDDQGGTFRTHLEPAALAVALKRRVNVLQAVEHAQSDPGNLFENFTRALKRDQQRLDELESGIAGVLVRLSALELARPNGLRPVFTQSEVDRMMRAAHRIHQLGDGVTVDNRTTDVASEIAATRTAQWSCSLRWPRRRSHALGDRGTGHGGVHQVPAGAGRPARAR
jgi:hypothetical protein